MALKSILDNVDSLPDDVKKEYKKGNDGKFYLDVDGIDDHPNVKGLKTSMENAKRERGEARDALAAVQTQLSSANDQLDDMRRGAIPKADVEALENSWKTKLTTKETELGGKITKLSGALDKNLRQATATQLASELFVSTSLGLPYILPRLKVEEEGEEFVVKVLDANGQPSASTLEDLKKEMVQNKEFAPILRGTRASGGGANGGNGGGGAPSNDKDFDAVSASPKDLAARITQRKQAEGG